MAHPLGYSEFSSDENLSNSGNNYNRNSGNNGKSRNSKEGFIARKRRTIKRREPLDQERAPPSKLTKQTLTAVDDGDDEDDGLANFTSEFTPPPRSESAGAERIDSRDPNIPKPDQSSEQNEEMNNDTNDPGVSPEGYQDMSGGYTENYVNQFVPYYQNVANVSTGNNNNNTEIAEKLNYLINLIEEQKDEKIGNVAEELILYSFLGVFVIYIVDSFARVGKYVR